MKYTKMDFLSFPEFDSSIYGAIVTVNSAKADEICCKWLDMLNAAAEPFVAPAWLMDSPFSPAGIEVEIDEAEEEERLAHNYASRCVSEMEAALCSAFVNSFEESEIRSLLNSLTHTHGWCSFDSTIRIHGGVELDADKIVAIWNESHDVKLPVRYEEW